MKTVLVALFAGMLGCAIAQPISAANSTTFQEEVLYSFCTAKQCRDGMIPDAGLMEMNGKLYGTTGGGGSHKVNDGHGGGTVFKLDPSTGAEQVLHGFCRRNRGCSDGETPVAGLIKMSGKLLGTTATGGSSGCYSACGTVFAVDPATNTEKVLYAFCRLQNCADGSGPGGSLIDVNGMLYGTTVAGGSGDDGYCDGCGTVFSLDPGTGTEKVLYSFCSQANCPDGMEPASALIAVNGVLYGTTSYGGNTGSDCPDGALGCGTVFSLDPATGAEKLVYTFCSQQNCADGYSPFSGLIDVNGTLYGATFGGGGTTGCSGYGCGTVFSLDPATGAEKVVYSFCSQQNCTDGEAPHASLIDVKGTLYGTTYGGGGTTCDGGFGCGTVFSLDPKSGAETVIYAFCSRQNCADGSNPRASLIYVNGVFYGTTESGGKGESLYCTGCGTVFALTTARPGLSVPRSVRQTGGGSE